MSRGRVRKPNNQRVVESGEGSEGQQELLQVHQQQKEDQEKCEFAT